jgi:hypothetical protein
VAAENMASELVPALAQAPDSSSQISSFGEFRINCGVSVALHSSRGIRAAVCQGNTTVGKKFRQKNRKRLEPTSGDGGNEN